ncbi:hypothetical protein [Nonomuraea ceibae]|uniref:hypothetical protein n=1 Tax=Nonomuraea ceibae TaxID=1935170 RepID=UPI001C5D9595|nr:hypothetical protein [Nonomuraea ceibae]
MIPAARLSNEDYAYWQLHAFNHLGQILAQHRQLHTLRWAIDPYGYGLRGEVVPSSDYTGAYDIEYLFAEWVKALGLDLLLTGSDQLAATGQHGGCRVTITASLPTPPQRKDTT